MIRIDAYDIERLAQLISALPLAPEGWVKAAQELPLARRGLDDIIARHIRALGGRTALARPAALSLSGSCESCVRRRSRTLKSRHRGQVEGGRTLAPMFYLGCPRSVNRLPSEGLLDRFLATAGMVRWASLRTHLAIPA